MDHVLLALYDPRINTNSHYGSAPGSDSHTKREAVQRPGDLFQTRHNGDLNPDYGP
ncbi:MAG TPA: hypothetical protein VFD63_05735 [Pyrinomonadaceae bacterium]|nr:hypothetical protein [Pyrinomonadaceae bacterium]